MNKYWVVILIVLIPVIFSCRKQSPEQLEKARLFQIADSTAKNFLDSISVRNKKNEDIWQLREFQIFGYSKIFSESLGRKYALTDSIFPSDTLTRLTYKTWVEGVDFSFSYAKQIRKIEITLSYHSGSYKVVDFSFIEIKPLSFFRQFLYFFLATLLLYVLVLFFPGNPAIGFIILNWISERFPANARPGCFSLLLTIVFDIIACYFLYVFFNSVGAVIIGIIPCTLIVLISSSLLFKE